MGTGRRRDCGFATGRSGWRRAGVWIAPWRRWGCARESSGCWPSPAPATSRSMRWPTCAASTPVRWWRCSTAWSAAAGCAGSATRATAACNGCSAPRPATACSRRALPRAQRAEAQQLAALSAGPTAPAGGRHAQIGDDFEMTRDAMKPFGSIVLSTLLAGAGGAFAQFSSGPAASAPPSAVVLPASGRNNQGGSVNADRTARARDHHQRQHAEPQRADLRTLQRQRAQHHGHALLRQAVAAGGAPARPGLQPGRGRGGANRASNAARR